MTLFWAIAFLIAGLVILWKCADVLVGGAVSLARRFSVSPLIVGLTILAMGTSAPEVAASIAAALRGLGDTALGNVYGSNIANLALVGGVCAMIRPLQVSRRTTRREIPIMLIAALILWPILHNLYLSRIEGVVLLVSYATYMVYIAGAA